MLSRRSALRIPAIILPLVLIITVTAACGSKKTTIQGANAGNLPNNGFPVSSIAGNNVNDVSEKIEAMLKGQPFPLEFKADGSGIVPLISVFPATGQTKLEFNALDGAGVDEAYLALFAGPKLSFASITMAQAQDDAAAQQASTDLWKALFDASTPKPEKVTETVAGTTFRGFLQDTYPPGTSDVMLFGSNGPFVIWVRLAGDSGAADAQTATSAAETFSGFVSKLQAP